MPMYQSTPAHSGIGDKRRMPCKFRGGRSRNTRGSGRDGMSVLLLRPQSLRSRYEGANLSPGPDKQQQQQQQHQRACKPTGADIASRRGL